MIRPLVKGTAAADRDRWPAILLAVGFTISAVAMYGAVWSLGAALLGDRRTSQATLVVAAVVLVALVAADTGRFGLRTFMWQRQTPRWFVYKYGERKAALFWGLDAGLVFTTFRVTSLSWAGLILTLVGLLPWWVGAVYAFGFVVPELVFNLLLPRRVDPTGASDPEPNWAVDALINARATLRPVGILALSAGAGWAVFAAALGG